MQRLWALIVLVGLGLMAYDRYGPHETAPPPPPMALGASAPARVEAPVAEYACDGRTTCPQMRSCDEARYFLAHCPNTTMDGDHDGIPCERQWCSVDDH